MANNTLNMILRNLRTEVARIEKANFDLINYTHKLEQELITYKSAAIKPEKKVQDPSRHEFCDREEN